MNPSVDPEEDVELGYMLMRACVAPLQVLSWPSGCHGTFWLECANTDGRVG